MRQRAEKLVKVFVAHHSKFHLIESRERSVLAMFVEFDFVKSLSSNPLRRSLNLFVFPHSSLALSAGFN